MPVSGIVVTCAQDRIAGVAEQMAALSGVEIHGVLPGGTIVAVIEADSVDEEVGLVSRMHELEGVATVRMAYHNFEDV